MKKVLILTTILLLSLDSFGQSLEYLAGEWRYSSNDTIIEISLKNQNFLYYGNTIECFVGGYLLKKNGFILVNNKSFVNLNLEVDQYPIYIFLYPDNNIAVRFKDYQKQNQAGEFKSIHEPSNSTGLVLISTSPYRIKISLQPDNREFWAFPDEVFPKGTSLPTEMIFTKVSE
ncbi:MAG: hypothetical protein J6Y40_03265 [Bacteroidales bacterium]|nr:hypothetical protein [Bacteroidales bacterium]